MSAANILTITDGQDTQKHLARTAVLAWVLLGAFRFPLGLATSPLLAGALLAVTGFASALTDIPLIALVQQRIPDRHLA